MLDRFLDILDKTRHGELISEKEWNYKIVPTETEAVLKEHGLMNSYDKENPINVDLGLADDFWQAGFELATRLGMYCPDTQRRVMFTEEEIKESMKNSVTEFQVGLGKDRVVVRKRRLEDRISPLAAMSPLGLEVSEELFIPIIQSIIQYTVVDFSQGCTLRTIHGHDIRARTPEETLSGMYEAVLMKEALRRAGRPGMPLFGVEGAPTEYGHFGGFCPGGFDPAQCVAIALFPEPAKLPYHILHRVAQSINGSYPIHAGHMLSIYGYFGPPEGGVVGSIALQLLLKAAVPIHQIDVESSILDARYFGNAGRETLWASSVSYQARSRNTPILDCGFTSQVNGPGTDMILYESALTALTDSVSGVSLEVGTRPAGCRYANHCSSLENKFTAEVIKASANLKLSDVAHIVKTIINTVPNYEDRLHHPSPGKSFTELMDLKTLQPTKDWLAVYERVWKELEDLGLQRP
jgi:methylamine--corrinoid protein Co-methyltransferase